MTQNKSNSDVRLTKDGSTTIYSDQFDQHYHNPNGAASESRYLFFDVPGVTEALKNSEEVVIFEMGFGTGLNLLLMKKYLEELKTDCRVIFNSVEAYPISSETASRLDFGDSFDSKETSDILERIFGSLIKGMNTIRISEQLTLNLYNGLFDDMPPIDKAIDFFFHDPFSPEVNGELWTPTVFNRLKEYASSQAVLSTYCAASSARASMAVAGWYVAKTLGALGKREMTIASVNESMLTPFKRINETRLIERYHGGDFNDF